ncbi:N-acetylglucosamine kinase [Paenibacillus sabuli]|nr:BadF/BadG/BcrA/BcrD ATPase family protein [Paenibacillus sabuli]
MIVAGVDGGGSKTLAVIADETGRVLGSGRSGCANHQIAGVEQAVAHMDEALQEALQASGLSRKRLDFVQYGLAGADRPHDFAVLTPALAGRLAGVPFGIVCDVYEGLRLASPQQVGVVLVCGSNTNAAGRNRAGETATASGFGTLFGDRAGGYYLADQAFARTIRSWDGREPETLLTARIPRALGFGGMAEMVDHYLDHDLAAAPLELARVVHDAADDGDWLSLALLREMGEELGLSASTVMRKLGGFGEMEELPLVLTGSILQAGRHPVLLEALLSRARAGHPGLKPVIPTLAPVFGAVLMAMDRMDIATAACTLHHFESYAEGM